MYRYIILPILFVLYFASVNAASNSNQSLFSPQKTNHYQSQLENFSDKPNTLIKIIKKRFQHTKRAMAAALAFPLPFGVLALHRIYLGTSAHVPVVYIGTVGGVFGILPFIDFCVMVLDRDVNRFLNNGKIFMWINEEK